MRAWTQGIGPFLLAGMLALPTGKVCAQPRSHLTDYLLLTDHETTSFGEVIWFYQGSVVTGPIRTNETFGINANPLFVSDITVCHSSLIEGFGYMPTFLGEVVVNADTMMAVHEPHTLDSLILRATLMGTFFRNPNHALQTRLQAAPGAWHYDQWPVDEPWSPDDVVASGTIPYSVNVPVVFEGDVDLYGSHARGMMTIGATGRVRIIDNLMVEGYSPDDLVAIDPYTYDPYNDHNVRDDQLAVVADSDIVVGNTVPNGRGNRGVWYPGNHDSSNVIITAFLVSQHGSFQIENQNNSPSDPNGWDGYWWCDPHGEHASESDERGTIYLRGGVTMFRRGYVHRSTCMGTGYERDYLYDARLAGHALPGLRGMRLIDLGSDVTFQDTTLLFASPEDQLFLCSRPPGGWLTLGPGTTLEIDASGMQGFSAISGTWLAGIDFRGTAENPVHIVVDSQDGEFRLVGGPVRPRTMEHVVLEGGRIATNVPQTLRHVRTATDSLRFVLSDRASHALVAVDSCRLNGHTSFASGAVVSVGRSVIEGSLEGTLDLVDHTVFLDREASLHPALRLTNPDRSTTAFSPVPIRPSFRQPAVGRSIIVPGPWRAGRSLLAASKWGRTPCPGSIRSSGIRIRAMCTCARAAP